MDERQIQAQVNELAAIKAKLAAIELLLQRLPEIQAAVFIKMYEEYQGGRLRGKTCDEMWTIAPPEIR